MKPVQRTLLGAAVLLVIFVASVCGFRFLADYSWLDSVWMVVITVSSVGYGEESSASDVTKVLSICVIVLGMTATGYFVGALFQTLLEGELQQALGQRRMTIEIGKLSGHAIICGYGRIGQILVEELRHQDIDLVVIDCDEERVQVAQQQDLLVVHGDATEEEMLLAAGLESASTLVISLPSDANNLFITLTGAEHNDNLRIIARAEQASSQKKLQRAGAGYVVMPADIGAKRMARIVTRPTTADIMDLMSTSNFLGMELDEIAVNDACRLVGKTVAESEAHRKHRILAVAVQRGKETLFNPDANHKFERDDVIVVMGHRKDIQRFRDAFNAQE